MKKPSEKSEIGTGAGADLQVERLFNTPGKMLVFMLQPRPLEQILDIGCGNGDLTAEIAASGAIPTGIDLSEEMINKARLKYPEIKFQVRDVRHYRTDMQFDAVFSHAALHWIKDAQSVVESIRLALKVGGRFVAEFAGSGNVATLTGAIRQALEMYGYASNDQSPWYLPTANEYAELLEQNGFRILMIEHFESPSPLKGDDGFRRWLSSFGGYFFADIAEADKEPIYNTIEGLVKPKLYKDGQWMADTCRLRVSAIKECES